MEIKVDAAVIGGGVIGIACGLALARAGKEVLVLEADANFGGGISSRNSGVVHAGLYYPEGSLKARLCVLGREMIYRFCVERNVPHARLGKLIVAKAGDSTRLEQIAGRASAAGVGDLRFLDRSEIVGLEPVLDAEAALFSPSTGILDSHAFMTAMLGELEARDGRLVCRAEVERLRQDQGEWEIFLHGSTEPDLRARWVVNAAGLAAQSLALRTEGLSPASVPPLHYARGCYYSYAGAVPFRHLVYPLPEPGGLGVHVTLDLAGRCRFGPTVEWVDGPDFTPPAVIPVSVAAAAMDLWPALDPDRLRPDFSSVRPKLSRTHDSDFVISDPQDHGLEGLVNLFGIESPGLTASMAVGDEVSGRLLGGLG